jgi:protein-L-isoaspartate(D-aspartate) O-methyltransferase
VLITLDESRALNNGQPSLWANLYDQIDLAAGQHVVHVGAGTGYYTAILADIVGRSGKVMAVEIDPGLAARAQENLAGVWPQATVVAADGFAFLPEQPADVIFVNAGVTHLSPAWLDPPAEQDGRLLVPLTGSDRAGVFILIKRRPKQSRFDARHVFEVGINRLRQRPRQGSSGDTRGSAADVPIQATDRVATP